MTKRVLKIITVLFIIFGVLFSITNFLPDKIGASGFQGTWVLKPDGSSWKCLGDGNDCALAFTGGGTTRYTGSSKKIRVIEKQPSIQKVTIYSDIRLVDRIKFPQQEMPTMTMDFCVTEDGIFMIPDYEEGNIKMYVRSKNVLSLVNIIGQKGFGSGEMGEPAYCFYNKPDSKFGVLDYGFRKIIIYDRVGRFDFKQSGSIFCMGLGYDMELIGDRLLISGFAYDKNGNPYDLYFIDINNYNKEFLLPSYYKYGLGGNEEYGKEYLKKSNIRAIGINGYFDTQGDDIFFAWEGDLTVIKFNIRKGFYTRFGMKTANYVKPFASRRILLGRQKLNSKIIMQEKAKMSYVRNIFVSKDYVLVIYQGPIKQKNENFRVQFYTLDGHFLNEMSIPASPNQRMKFNRDKHVLYSLCNDTGESPEYYILKYKINFSIKKS